MAHETVIRNGLIVKSVVSGSTASNIVVIDEDGNIKKINSIDSYIGDINSILDYINGEVL